MHKIPKRTIVYSPRQLNDVVSFINTNNVYIKEKITLESVMKHVLNSCFHKDVNTVGTAGWYCLISAEIVADGSIIYLDFVVDPSVSQDHPYIEAEVIDV